MAIISSHTLNGTDGTHAGGIAVRLMNPDGTLLMGGEMDEGGRLTLNVEAELIDPSASYELVFETAAYWEARSIPREGPQILREVVIRFSMPDPDGRYHLPVILSPNSYSVWWSA